MREVVKAVLARVGSRSVVSSMVELAGAGTMSVGAGMVYRPAGVMLAGAWLVVFGFAGGGR